MFGFLKKLFGASPEAVPARESGPQTPVPQDPPPTEPVAPAAQSLPSDEILLAGLWGSERRLAASVLDDTRNGRIELPTLPDIATKVGRAVNDPETSIDDVALIIQVDPVIAGKLVQAANSAVFGGYQPASNLTQAITRMGLNQTRDMVLSLAMKDVFRIEDRELQIMARTLWQDSVRVAAISAVLAGTIEGVDGERALLAGLMHDIGSVAILKYAATSGDQPYSGVEIEQATQHLKGVIGNLVLNNWKFDQQLGQVPMYVANMQEAIPGPASYSDVVRVAKIHSLFGRPELEQYPPVMELSSFAKLDLILDGPEKSISVLREAKAQIDALRAMLDG